MERNRIIIPIRGNALAGSKPNLGVIGVGLMGHGIAKNLVEKGFATSVLGHRNRAPVDDLVKRGARAALSAPDLAAGADIIIVCVPATPDVERILLGAGGLLEAARPGQIIVDCSTSEPDSTLRLDALAAAKGVRFADAPLARTPKEAEEGRLNTMVGADPEVFAAIRPVLEAFCENIFHLGGVGSGHKVKLLNNLLTMGQAALIAEALVTGAKAGVDLKAFCEVITAGGANSGIFQMLAVKAMAGDYAGLNFGLDLARKDLRYYTHLAEQLGVPSPMGDAVHQCFVEASALGFGPRLVASLIEAKAQVAGATVVPR